MLAYVFWHHPREGADLERYEGSLVRLHQMLASVAAVTESLTFRVSNVPWINAGSSAFEDWYAVNDWMQLGALNDAAVSADRKPPHDAVANDYGAGAGAVYGLRRGSGDLHASTNAIWLAKPKGMAYAEFDRLLEPAIASGSTLWRRQMVLGPGPEFCLSGLSAVSLPEPLQGTTVLRSPLPASS